MLFRPAFARWTEFLIAAIVLPIILSFIVHYGYFSGCTRGVFTRESNRAQDTTSIFKYRVLARTIFFSVQPELSRLAPKKYRPVDDLLRAGQPDADPSFYFAWYLFNTFFLCLNGVVLWVLFRGMRRPPNDLDLMRMLLCLFLIVISQYVLTLYDLPAFFFVGLGMIVVLADLSVLVRAVLLTMIVCLGAATRETASLILAFAACAYFLQHRLRIHRDLIPIVAATCGFIVVYVSLRLALGGGDAVSMGLMFRENLHFRSLVGILFLISILFFLYREASSVQRRALIVFQITSAPYLVPVVLVGLWFEIRLWVPLLICMIVVRAYAESLWADGPLELPWIARRASLQAATAESGRG